jgi:predicted nucleic acid-binding protein
LNIVVDSSVLVGEVLRERGLKWLTHPALTLFQPDHAASETAHELRRRGRLMVERGRLEPSSMDALLESAFALIAARVVVVAASEYAVREDEARRRVPRDPGDWTLVALALHLGGAAILTLDGDFLGCGLPTWTPDTLRSALNVEVGGGG